MDLSFARCHLRLRNAPFPLTPTLSRRERENQPSGSDSGVLRSACPAEADFYNPPMLDIKMIRENPEAVRERLAARGAGEESKLAELLALDERRRKFLAEVEQLKSLRNRISKEIGALMGQKKLPEAEIK